MALEDIIENKIKTFVELLRFGSEIANNIGELGTQAEIVEPLIRADPSISQEHKLEAKNRYNAKVNAIKAAADSLALIT